jgi:hypothetical protein
MATDVRWAAVLAKASDSGHAVTFVGGWAWKEALVKLAANVTGALVANCERHCGHGDNCSGDVSKDKESVHDKDVVSTSV